MQQNEDRTVTNVTEILLHVTLNYMYQLNQAKPHEDW